VETLELFGKFYYKASTEKIKRLDDYAIIRRIDLAECKSIRRI